MLFFIASARTSTLTNVQTVFLIVMENVNWSALKGNPSAPYINNTLVPMASYCEQYYTPPGLPGSLPVANDTHMNLATGTYNIYVLAAAATDVGNVLVTTE